MGIAKSSSLDGIHDEINNNMTRTWFICNLFESSISTTLFGNNSESCLCKRNWNLMLVCNDKNLVRQITMEDSCFKLFARKIARKSGSTNYKFHFIPAALCAWIILIRIPLTTFGLLNDKREKCRKFLCLIVPYETNNLFPPVYIAYLLWFLNHFFSCFYWR